MRKVLIVSQFTISIALTICTAITYRQVKFLQEANLGYDVNHTMVLDISLPGVREKVEVLKTALAANPNVLGATATSQLPIDIQTAENIDVSASESKGVNCISVDADFFKVMGIAIRQGQERINAIQPNDTLNYFVLNTQALASIGWTEDDALNKRISIRHGNQKPGPIMGVVDDFHFQSLHHAIAPLTIEFNPNSFQYLLVKVKAENLSETISFMKNTWDKLSAGIPFDYDFLDQRYNNLYKAEQRSSALFIVFAGLAVFISLLGLFGLSSFAVELRTKEIGVRKILGADMASVLALVSREFLLLVLISFFIALPLGYYYLQNWLSHFAFRADVGIGLFVLCGITNLVLAIAAVSYQSVRISKTNPMEALRYE